MGITEGSSKLASVPSGGAGGAAPAAGGAAASGGAAAEEKAEEKEEEKEESRGYGFRSFRLNEQNISSRMTPGSRYFTTNGQGFWEELCALCKEFACHGKWVGLTAFYDKMSRMQVTLMQ